jgi:hypothetical protein
MARARAQPPETQLPTTVSLWPLIGLVNRILQQLSVWRPIELLLQESEYLPTFVAQRKLPSRNSLLTISSKYIYRRPPRSWGACANTVWVHPTTRGKTVKDPSPLSPLVLRLSEKADSQVVENRGKWR